MSYITRDDLKGRIPDDWLTAALDDQGSGMEDPLSVAAVLEDTDDDIDGRLAPRFDTPVAGPPAVVKAAAKAIAAMFCYKRRGVGDDANPWFDEAKAYREKLDAIGRGEIQMEHDGTAAVPDGAVVTEPSRLYQADGRMLI